MRPNYQTLSAELALAREELKRLQTRIAVLEAGLAHEPSVLNSLNLPTTPHQSQQLADEVRYRHIVEEQVDLVCRFQPDFHYTFVNRAYCEAFGKSRAELIGQNLLDQIPQAEHQRVIDHFRLVSLGEPVPPLEGYLPLANGERRWFEWTTQIIRNAAGQLAEFQGIGRDITQRKQAEAAEQEQRCLTAALRDSVIALINLPTVEQVMQQLLASAATVVPCEVGSIILFAQHDGYIAALHGFPPDVEADLCQQHFPLTTIIPEGVVNTASPYLVPDTQRRPVWFPAPDGAEIRSTLGVPIASHGKVSGLLMLASVTVNHFCAADLDKLSFFVRYASLALEKAQYISQLETRVNTRTAELKAAKEQVEAILYHHPYGILIVKPDWGIQQINPAFQRLVGCTGEDCSSGALFRLLQQDQIAQVKQAFQAVRQTQVSQQLEIQVNRLDGTAFEAALNISPLPDGNLICTLHDVTKRKRALVALAEERNLLRTLIDVLPDFIYAKDRQHRFILSNLAHAQARGAQQPDELLGKTDFDFFPMHLAEQFQTEEAQILQTGLPLLDYEQPSCGYSGGFAWASSSKVPLRNLSGEMIGLVGITRDISERRMQERQLRHYASLQENVTDAVIATDLAWRIQSWNQAAESIYGWQAPEVLGRPLPEVLQTEWTTTEARDEQRKAIFQQGRWRGELIQHHKDKTLLHILASVTLFRDTQGKPLGIVSVNHDITERKRTEEALKQYTQEIEAIYNQAPCGYHSLNADGVFVQINDTELRWLGYPREEIIGVRKLTDFLTPKSRETFHAIFPVAQTPGELKDMEHELIGKDGRMMTVLLNTKGVYDEQGQFVKSLSSFSDITARKQAEAAIRASETRYRLLADNITDLVMRNSADGKAVYVSPSSQTLLGYAPEELLGQTWHKYVHPEDIISIKMLYQNTLEQHLDRSRLIYRMQHKQGHYIWIESHSQTIYSTETGEVLEFVSSSRDITERKHAETVLQQALQQEKELGELKSRFVSMASHEFRTPLTSLLAAVETLRVYRSKLSEEQLERRLAKIGEEGDYLKLLIEDVLQLSYLQASRSEFKRVQLDLDALCRSVLDELEQQFAGADRLHYICDETLRKVQLNPLLMRQILSNLVANALKYTPTPKAVHVQLSHQNAALVCVVCDEGIGIPDAEVKYLFQPFHRATNVGAIAGTGLGLSIVKEAIELQGGTIAVNSAVNGGTRFTVSIPLA